MIVRLEGTVLDEQGDRLTVDVGGIGYEVIVPAFALKVLRARNLPADDPTARLAGSGAKVVLHIYHHVPERKPVPVLFGFHDAQERKFFELLAGVSRFGPMAAAKSMVISARDYAGRIMTRDARSLCALPGIGPGKADQIIAQLRSRVALFAMIPEEEIPERPEAPDGEFVVQAQIALEDLGYRRAEAEMMVQSARQANPRANTLEDLLETVWAQSRDRR